MATRKFELTTTILNEWFDTFNSKYFNGELPKWKFKIKGNCTSYFGKCRYDKQEIIMCVYYDRDEFGFKNTLIHEMIHEWQFVKGLSLGHGIDFKNKAKEINKDGWKIKRCSSDNSRPVSPKAKRKERSDSKYVTLVTYERPNGYEYFTLVAETKVKLFSEFMQKHSDKYINPHWYKVMYYPFKIEGFIKCTNKIHSYNCYGINKRMIYDNMVEELGCVA